MNLPEVNKVYQSNMYLPNPKETFGGAIVIGGLGPRKRFPGFKGYKPIIPVKTRPPISYCSNRLCQLSSSGGCCPGYACRPSTGLAVGMGTCQRVSGRF